MNKIIKHEPQIVISLKDGRKLLTAAKNRPIIEERWNKHLPTTIEGITVDAYKIDTVEELTNEYDILLGLPEEERTRALQRFAEFTRNLGRSPTRNERKNIIQKILNS